MDHTINFSQNVQSILSTKEPIEIAEELLQVSSIEGRSWSSASAHGESFTVCVLFHPTHAAHFHAQAKAALHNVTEKLRLQGTAKQKLEEQLTIARGNVGKAETLLNNRERYVQTSRDGMHGFSLILS